jgi:type II secretory pathway component GspD/PulD (secretin)
MLRMAWLVLVLLAWIVRPAAAQTGMTVKVYSCPAGTAQGMADRLLHEFGVIPGVRIAADPRTSQVIAQAPPEVQAQISQRMAGVAAESAGYPRSGSAAAQLPAADSPVRLPAGQMRSRSVALRRLRAEQLEAALWNMLGDRLSATPGGSSEIRRYRLALASGGAVMLTLDVPGRQVVIDGSTLAVDACQRLVRILDSSVPDGRESTQVVPLRTGRPESVERAARAILTAMGPTAGRLPMALALFQPHGDAAAPAPAAPAPAPPEPAAKPGAGLAEGAPALGGLVNPVQIESLEGLDLLVIRGSRNDVDQVVEVIRQIERLSTETEPAIEVYWLQHVECVALATVLRSLYDEVFLARQGYVSITPLVKPNAVLLAGRKENVQRAMDLIRRLDEPVAPETQFRVFPLKHAAASAAQVTLTQVFADRGQLGPVVRVTPDVRSNALVVQAAPRDLEEVAAVLRRIDVSKSAAVNEVRIIPLEHTLAQDVASVLQSASGTAAGARAGAGAAAAPGGPGTATQPAATSAAGGGDQRSVMLRFLTIDVKGRRLLESGILNDVRITPDVRSNALVISAPAESLELFEALIHQLDRLPSAEAQIKVFMIVNGDAATLVSMLQALFFAQSQTTQGAQGAQGAMAGQAGGANVPVGGVGENLTVPLRFAYDTRTNSIIASGALSDLGVVEAILTRLDDSDAGHRKNHVFRLKNSPANDIGTAISTFLRSQVQTQTVPGLVSPFEQIEHEVIVVPEPVSNSLILSATPRYFEEIKKLIEELDARPPMVMIQVLIASVTLGCTNEFGMELGLQDSLLFDRSILNNIQYLTTTNTLPNGTQTTTQSVVSATNQPGFQFTTQPPGNSGASNALSGASKVGGLGATNLGLGTTDPQLGYGGIVLSASSESVSFLLRALAEDHRVDILQRPQIMTLDNQPAFVMVGQRVPTISSTSLTQVGQTNSVQYQNVGLMLGVTPRISPDGLVVMQIDATNSSLADISTGIPVAISEGQVIRQPVINNTQAQTTVSAMSGQTVILGGLITTTKNEEHHKVPCLGDIPVLGNFFRYDATSKERDELLIIMTPHIVRTESDMDLIKQAEAARMSWCLSDVTALHGEAGLRNRSDAWSDSEVPTVYPDGSPPGASKPSGLELLPTPQAIPDPPGAAGSALRQNNSAVLGQPGAPPPGAPPGILNPVSVQQGWYPGAAPPTGVQPATYNQPAAPWPAGAQGPPPPGSFAPQASPPGPQSSPEPWYRN